MVSVLVGQFYWNLTFFCKLERIDFTGAQLLDINFEKSQLENSRFFTSWLFDVKNKGSISKDIWIKATKMEKDLYEANKWIRTINIIINDSDIFLKEIDSN